MSLYDCHIHLSDKEYSGYIDHVIESMRAMKIVACSVAVDNETALRSLDLFSSSRDIVRQFIGIHPEFAGKEDLDKFKEIFQSNIDRIDGIGEIGLDPTYVERTGVEFSEQKKVFDLMLKLAETTKKPISIHSRQSLDEILQVLPSYNIGNALLHWFAGSKKQLAIAMDLGLFVSFGPPLLYSDDKKTLLKKAQRNKVLFETDGPVRYSRCFENLPALPTSCMVSVVSAAARAIDVPFAEMVRVAEENSLAFLSS